MGQHGLLGIEGRLKSVTRRSEDGVQAIAGGFYYKALIALDPIAQKGIVAGQSSLHRFGVFVPKPAALF
jgi:hypothetical protein